MQIIVEYINYLETEADYSFNSLRLYKRDLLDFDTFVKAKYPNLEVQNLNKEILKEFKAWVLDQGKSTASINRKLTALHGMWIWLRDQNEVEGDPFTQIIRESQYRNSKAKTLSIEEMNTLLDHRDHDLRTKMVLELMYCTGIRIGELAKLTITDLDLENQLLTIPRKGRVKERVIPFNALCKSYLEEFIEGEGLEENDKLLLTREETPLSEREIFRIIRDAAKEVGLEEKVSPSIIRNSFIHHLKENGAHEVLIRDLTGQKSYLA